MWFALGWMFAVQLASGCPSLDSSPVVNDRASVSSASQQTEGVVTGTITSSEPGAVVGNMSCIADVNALGSGKSIISCVGQSPGDTTKLFNVLFVSK